METTTLQPTTVTDEAKYYEFKQGTLTNELLKELIPAKIMECYEIEFYNYDTTGQECLIITNKGSRTNRYHINLRSVYEVKVQDNVCFTLTSHNFNLSLFEEVGYISLITF